LPALRPDVCRPRRRSQAADETRAEPVRREILAVYDSREEPRPDQTRIHRFAEMPLNYFGFVVTYWDVNAGMPGADRSENLRGIITWLRRPPPAAFYAWAQQQVSQGVRMVVLGDSGLPSGNTSLADANKLFAEIGFGLSGAAVDITYGTRILHRDELIGFERPLDPVLPAFPIVGTFGSDVSSHLILEHREGNLVLATSVVLTSSRGGYAANGYFVYEEPGTGRTKWLIDPFAFFQKAFGAEMMPIPDVTTLSGPRAWFSHIDGDGWNNVTYIEAYRDKPTIAAGVILRELIAPYPDLPVAVGVIGADIDERYGTPEAARQAARELFALPQVEVATHTYTHPYQWSFFENYDRRLEERIIGPDESEWKAVLGDRMRRIARRLFPGLVRKGGETEGKFIDDDPPRAYSDYPFDLDQEIRGAITAAEEMAPEASWGPSGRAAPSRWRARSRTRRLGCAISMAATREPRLSDQLSRADLARRGSSVIWPAAPATTSITDGGRPRSRLPAPRRHHQCDQKVRAACRSTLLPHVRGRTRRLRGRRHHPTPPGRRR
jgi:hypothetical protein